MVTMRRDVAAMQKNDIFDYDRACGEITEYDRFMQEKLKSENKSYYYSTDYFKKPDETYAISETISTAMDRVEPNEVASAKQHNKNKKEGFMDYNAYMIAQLNRKAPEKILSEEEFYHVKHKRHAISKTRKVAKQSTEKARLSKRARIFIGVYMLAVAVVGVLFFFLI